MSHVELRERLSALHHEVAPKTWSRTQLLLRLTELEGVESIHSSGTKETPPLRQAEIMINKAARKKSVLVDFMQSQLGLVVNATDTIEQLKVKAMNQAYACSPAHPEDHVEFGQHSALTYREVAMEMTSYLEWAITTMKEGPCCARLKRLADWGLSPVGQALMSECKFESSTTKKGSKGHNHKGHPTQDKLVASLVHQVTALTEEVKNLQSQKARKVKNEGEEISSNDWDRMSSAPSTA